MSVNAQRFTMGRMLLDHPRGLPHGHVKRQQPLLRKQGRVGQLKSLHSRRQSTLAWLEADLEAVEVVACL